MSVRRLLVLVALVPLGLSGCAEDSGGSTGDTVEDQAGAPEELPTSLSPEDAAPTGSDTVGGSASEGATAVVEALSFPDRVTTTAGQPVTFDNEDSVAHTVTSGVPDDAEDEDAGVFDEDLPTGEQVTITVDDPGTYRFYCEIHQQMTSRLVVEPA